MQVLLRFSWAIDMRGWNLPYSWWRFRALPGTILSLCGLLAACAVPADGFLARGLADHRYIEGARRNLEGQPEAAFEAWAQAAAAGHTKAQFQLAHLYGSDTLGPRDQEKALALARQAAADGFAPAAHYVGMSLLYGWGGLDKDPAAAEPFLRRAVAADIGRARADLGTLLLDRAEDGHAGARAEGLALLEQAVAEDEPVAQFRLGEALIDGRHMARDPGRATHLLTAAMEAGEYRAALPLARMRILGDGGPVDRAAGLALLERIETEAPAHVKVTVARALLDADDALPHDPRRARRLLEDAADAGRITAHTALGKLLAEGADGVAPDPAAAVAHLRTAAEAGNGEATRYMGRLLEHQGRADEALAWFVEAAARGHAHAAVEGARLLLARGDGASARRALSLLGEVAATHAPAAMQLARLARDGLPSVLPADHATARSWLQHVRATGSGKAAAQATKDLARMVLRGHGGPPDPVAAVALFRAAAAAGHGWAALELGRLYERGADPVAPDPARAWHWYREAAARGVAQAHTALGKMLLAEDRAGPDTLRQAFAHFRTAAAGGHTWALYEAGKAAERGAAGQPGDPAVALAWYQRAAAHGVDAAPGAIASLYERGLGVPKDEARALALYHRGARAGNAWAAYKVGAFVAEGRGTPADPDAARAWLLQARADGVAQAADMLARLERGEVGPFGRESGGTDGPRLRIPIKPSGRQ
ncbi:tetratricopeptide repeat protein [uncultured Rhodospira sp.]|uniref:tetratricopeptide repeat protein n=1 Tax=uncultured Rhodospira sp. TaxID=1936189 RepID=UPI00262A28C1|nr:tetratricopeptide repeat protein [uncultured Rhodospira sp.]